MGQQLARLDSGARLGIVNPAVFPAWSRRAWWADGRAAAMIATRAPSIGAGPASCRGATAPVRLRTW